MERQLVGSRALYKRRAALMAQALARHMPEGTTWTMPEGGCYILLTALDGVDTATLSSAARSRRLAYVAGQPFYPGDDGAAPMRLAYGRVPDDLIDEGIRRIGEVFRRTMEAK